MEMNFEHYNFSFVFVHEKFMSERKLRDTKNAKYSTDFASLFGVFSNDKALTVQFELD